MQVSKYTLMAGVALALGLAACGGGGGSGDDAGSGAWTDEDRPFCNSWSRSEVETFIESPTLTEHREGADFCVWDSKAHVTSGAGTGVVELRATVYGGMEQYQKLAAAPERITDTFDGPNGPVLQANGVYMLEVSGGNMLFVSGTRGDDWTDEQEADARTVLLAVAERYEP